MVDERLTVEIDQETKRQFKSKAALEGKNLKEKLLELILDYIQS